MYLVRRMKKGLVIFVSLKRAKKQYLEAALRRLAVWPWGLGTSALRDAGCLV